MTGNLVGLSHVCHFLLTEDPLQSISLFRGIKSLSRRILAPQYRLEQSIGDSIVWIHGNGFLDPLQRTIKISLDEGCGRKQVADPNGEGSNSLARSSCS